MPKKRGREGHKRQGPKKKIVEGFPWKTLFFKRAKRTLGMWNRRPNLCIYHNSEPGNKTGTAREAGSWQMKGIYIVYFSQEEREDS